MALRIKCSGLLILLLLVSLVIPSTSMGITWPIACGRAEAPITSAYGPRCFGSGDFHAGIDIRIWTSKDVVAVENGTVVVSDPDWHGYGNTVLIRHGQANNYWYSGYHHLDQRKVFYDDVVVEGQLIAIAGSSHLHFNYWDSSFSDQSNDNNTLHPLRLFGGSGSFDICVHCPCFPVSALQVDHCGQLLEVGVGLGTDPYSPPFSTFVWDYENNVRHYTVTSGDYEPGECYLGYNSQTGVSPTSYDATTGTKTYFTFPASEGDWILENSSYTYALSVDGSVVTIMRSVSDLFQNFITNVSSDKVEVSWSISSDNVHAGDFLIKKGEARDGLFNTEIQVGETGDKSFSFVDYNIEAGATYYYAINWNDGKKSLSSQIIEVEVPDGSMALFMSSPYPNPSRGRTSVSYSVPMGKQYILSIYDVTGRLVKVLDNGSGMDKEIALTWDGTNRQGRRVAPGFYFFRLAVKGHLPLTRKLIILR
jgi:murein DD-endopeptidase MepM/ murein hydrolase activator NlpD